MDVSTLNHLYLDAVDRHQKRDAFRAKRDGAYQDVSHADFASAVERASLGLVSLGIAPGDRVALLSENRLEWALADFAILSARAVTVPIYPTLLPHQIEYQLKNSGSKILFVSSADQLAKIEPIRPALPDLAHVVVLDATDKPAPDTIPLDGLLTRGADVARTAPGRHREQALGATPESLASIIYTSGTTGVPKGVMLTHGNIVSNVLAVMEVLAFDATDSHLSFLPLSHIFERMAGQFAMFHRGVTIAYAESLETVTVNLLEVRPTLLLAVPRLYEKIRARVLEKAAAAPPARQKLFRWALEVGARASERELTGRRLGAGLALQRAAASRLVWRKIHAVLGGRVRLLVSGGAPLPPEVARFFFSVGLPLREGYGLTETSPVITVNTPAATRIGTVGRPIPGVELRIAGDGEILTRGPHIMKGYYRDETGTREVIDGEGWFHTGDIGMIDAEGYLAITDRKKDLVVTAGGKNIAPAPIENLLKTSPLIAEAMLIADGRRFPVALVVPDFAALRARAERDRIEVTSEAELCRHPNMVGAVKGEVDRLSADLASYERVKRIALVEREFSIADGELTPTMKLKRKVVAEKHKALIDSLYEEG